MSISSPETYRGLLRKAKKVCEKARILMKKTDNNGFYKLTSWDSIDQAVENLIDTRAKLSVKIQELKKESSQKEKYEFCLKEIEGLLKKLRDKQRGRNNPKRIL